MASFCDTSVSLYIRRALTTMRRNSQLDSRARNFLLFPRFALLVCLSSIVILCLAKSFIGIGFLSELCLVE